MVPKLTPFVSSLTRLTLLLGVACAYAVSATAQSMVQVPFGSLYVGVPASTFNGTDGQPCTSTTPGYLDFYGDGCPATQATLSLPAGIAIDAINNLYIADYNDKLIRVVYQGGATAAALLVAANPLFSFSPVAGSIYPVGGGGASLTSFTGTFYCSNVKGSGPTALNKAGDGCPAQYSYNQARAVGVDREGNIFIAGVQPFNGVRVVYAGGPIGARLITAYNPTVTSPQIGYVYPLSANGDFVSIRGIAVDDNDNIYAADTGAQAAASAGLQAATTGNQIKKFSGTGWTTFVLGSAAASATTPNGDGGPASAAILNNALGLLTDHSGNVYFTEGSGRIRVVYNGGSTPPLYVQGANSVVITSPLAGNVYSVAGGGTARSSGSLASTLNTSVSGSNLSSIALDNSGNLLFTDSQSTTYGFTWRVDARTGVAVIIGGNGTKAASFSAATAPAAGVACNGATGGPVMSDAYGDGCPATEILPYLPRSAMVFDTAGNFYQSEVRTSATNGIIRKYTFTNQFGAVAVGSTASASLAFTPTTATTALTPTPSYVVTGDPTAEFADAGSLCSLSGNVAVQTCIYNATFKPSLAGARLGALTLSSGGASLVSVPIGGTGVAPQLTLDPATQQTIGSTFKPSGTAVDEGGNVYIADQTTGSLFVSANGAAPTQVATGYKNPAQVAVDNSGNVFVADTGNNRIAVAVGTSLSAAELNAINGLALSGPFGVATDLLGNLYIADSGNNRVLTVTPLGGVSTRSFTGLNAPHGVTVDAVGNVFVADTGNARIVELSPASPGSQPVQTVVAVSPSLITPVAVAVDPAGGLYIADAGSQNVVLLPAGSSIAGPLLGSTAGIAGVAVDSVGDVFVASTSLTGLVGLNRTRIAYAFPETNVGLTSTVALTLSNTGSSNLVLGSSLGTGTDTIDFSTGPASTSSCSTGQSLAPGQRCSVLATFMPQARASLQSTVSFSSNAANTVSALLTGTGVQKFATTSALAYTTTAGGQPIAGQAFTVTATITPATSSGPVTGTVTFTVDGGSPSTVPVTNGAASTSLTLAAGSHSIASSYSGDSTYVASNATLTVVAVAPAATTTGLAVTSSGTPANNTPFTVTATISSAASQGAFSGSVVFSVADVTPAQTQTVAVTNGKASATFTLPTGKYTINAAYSGSAYYLSSSTTAAVQVIPAGTSAIKLTLVSPTGSTIALGQTITLSAATTTGNATATPTGTIVFTVDGGSAQSSAYAPSVTASFSSLTAGPHLLAVTYSGDSSYAPATDSSSITVARANPATVLKVTPNVSASGNSLIITATVSSAFATPTGTVALSIGGSSFGTSTLVNGVATFITTTSVSPSYVFSAAYSGDANFQPATFSSSPAPDFVAVIQTPSVTTPQYGVALDYLTLNSFFGYTGTVTVTCAGAPQASICRTTPTTTTVAKDAVTTIQLQVLTDVDSKYAHSTAAPFAHQTPTLAVAATIGLLLLIPLARHRRRFRKMYPGISLSLLLLAMVSGLSGCGSDTQTPVVFNTPVGTYPITITATDGVNSHSVTMSLVVIAGSPGRP